MGNHDYIISEVKFFQEQDRDATKEFLSGTGIDLDKRCASKIPTFLQIDENIKKFGLIPTRNGNEVEVANSNKDVLFSLIFDNDTTEETQVFMFKIGRGSNYEILIDFIKFLGTSFGKFLIYSDSGIMTLITSEKLTKQILKEFTE
ncbi:hypothetical protein H8S95_03855 [Pontibacter sp. KCTC 32443]|uniref:hypothetical protein n=1 Tax=Pontibacter TaxID=323449 RepID=UPI00164CE269|nr:MULTISPECIES: hypothetical protein [Pontibacter]MBC5773187.1 hypothetical protein [Pontibacter sp. KCTC 32443]